MPNIGLAELGVIGVIALLIFGPRQLPRLAKGLGESIREFRSAGKELMKTIDEEANK